MKVEKIQATIMEVLSSRFDQLFDSAHLDGNTFSFKSQDESNGYTFHFRYNDIYELDVEALAGKILRGIELNNRQITAGHGYEFHDERMIRTAYGFPFFDDDSLHIDIV